MKIPNLLLLIILFITPRLIYSDDDMETIIITAEIVEDTGENHSKTVITEDEIKSLPGATTPELISNVMGVKLSKFGNDAQPSFISIRGSSPEQVLVLLNGKKLNSSQGGGVDLSTIPPESIKKIEVIRGGNSAVYGGNAFGGIINIITKDVITSYTTYKYDYGTDNRNNFSINLYKNYNNLKISANTDALYSPGTYNFTGKEGDQKRENSDVKSLSTSIGITKLNNQMEIDLSGNFYMADKGVPGIIEFPTNSARIKDLQITGNIGFIYNILKWDMNYLYKKRNYTDPNGNFGPIDNTHDYRSASTLLTYNNLYGNIELSGNYDYLKSTSYNEDFVDKKNISLYISRKFNFFPIEITPSTRLDYNLEQKLLFSWSFNISYIPAGEKMEITASTGSAYREPSFNDLFWPETSFANGNPDLHDENAIITDLGFLYRITDSVQLETTIYYHYISNLIQWNPGPGGIWTPGNIGQAEIMGVESEITYLMDFIPIAGYLEGRINYTYLSALNKEKGILYNKQLINRTAHKGNFLLIYYSDYDFTLSVDLGYTGHRYTTSANTKSASGYLLLDMSFSKEILTNTILNVYGKNILNIEYEDYRGYPVPGFILGLGIEYRIGENE